MRRGILFLVLALLGAASVDAQFLRGLRRNSATIDQPPVLIIDTPTAQAAHGLTAGTLEVQGTATDDEGNHVSSEDVQW